MMVRITVLVVDDHTLFRETVAELLCRQPQITVVGATGCGKEAVVLARHLRPRVVLMDINLPGISGIAATRQITEAVPATRVLAVSLHTQWPIVRQVLQGGASGYVTKTSSWVELVQALQQVAGGYRYVCQELTRYLARVVEGEPATGVEALTARELEVLRLLPTGASSQEMARMLCVSKKTIESHRHHILKKLKVRSTTALVDWVHTHGLLG